MADPRILMAIPAYNCEKQIRRVLSGLARIRPELAFVDKVIVFDNQSSDSTLAEAEAQIQIDQTERWIEARKNPRNVGLGGTHKIAFAEALAQNFSHLIIFHGDDQGEAQDLPRLIRNLQLDYDAVLGSRFMSGSKRPGYSWLRIGGNRLLNLAYSLLTFKKIEDLGSGLNGFRVSTLRSLPFQNFSNDFTFNMDLLLALVGVKARLCFIPITWKELDQVSNARTFRVGWQSLKTLFAWRFHARN